MKQVIKPYDAILNIKKGRDCHNNYESCFSHKKCDECPYYIDSETLDLSLEVLEKYVAYHQSVNNSNSGTVSRHVVMSHLENAQYSAEFCQEYGIGNSINTDTAETISMLLPPVQPEPPKGEWVEADIDSRYVTCSCCKKNNIKGRMAYVPAYAATLNFCPTCGADMRQSSLLLRRK